MIRDLSDFCPAGERLTVRITQEYDRERGIFFGEVLTFNARLILKMSLQRGDILLFKNIAKDRNIGECLFIDYEDIIAFKVKEKSEDK